MSAFDRVKSLIERGKIEENIPTGFKKLNKYVGLYRGTYYLIGGLSGTGKSSLVWDAFILNPYDWYLKNQQKTKIKLKIILFSMERNSDYIRAKWISRKLFLDHGEILPINTIIGRVDPEFKTSEEQERLIDLYEDYIDNMESTGFLDIIDGPQNPMGIKKYVDNYARSHGHFEKTGPFSSRYVPDDPNEMVIAIYDHIGLLKHETRTEIDKEDKERKIKVNYFTKKEIIDLASADAQRFRDTYGYSVVFVSQFNRSISNPIRIKSGSVQPSSEDFKESSEPFEAADVVMALFDPIRYKIAFPDNKDTLGYDLNKVRDERGAKKYKSLHVLKNTYGADDIQIGMGFQPVVGLFKEMPNIKDMTDEIYERVQNDTYFLIDK